MTDDELIAALESAPTGTRELGVAVLEATGCVGSSDGFGWENPVDYEFYIIEGDEARVVTDLNFRLPGVPHMWWKLFNTATGWRAETGFMYGDGHFTGAARTERLARCVVELKAVLAARNVENQSTTERGTT